MVEILFKFGTIQLVGGSLRRCGCLSFDNISKCTDAFHFGPKICGHSSCFFPTNIFMLIKLFIAEIRFLPQSIGLPNTL